MARFWLLGFLICGNTGCTMMSLERHTVAQTDSTIDLRYHEIMDNLAMIAHNPSTLPAYASIYAGTIFVSDQAQVISMTNWQHMIPATKDGFASEMASPSVNRMINQNWAIDPVVGPEKLEAIRAACQWAIGGPEAVNKDSMTLLIRAEQAPPGPGRHFDVAEGLAKLPAEWLCKGKLKDVPICARYKSHCSETWVWVTPDGMKGLADFALILQNIARVPIETPSLFHFPPVYSQIRFETTDSRAVDAQVQIIAQVTVDQNGHLVPDSPYIKHRQDFAASDGKLRSLIAAAGATPR